MREDRKNVSLLLMLFIIFVFGVSCATVGRDFPTDPVSQIQIGTTTQTDINRMFGTPWRTGIDNGGFSTPQ